uniref:Uncharacterized protein n=1 Tax=Oxyrrhis marina TaxID=2969 RepID=A0A7S3UM15_OXYMA
MGKASRVVKSKATTKETAVRKTTTKKEVKQTQDVKKLEKVFKKKKQKGGNSAAAQPEASSKSEGSTGPKIPERYKKARKGKKDLKARRDAFVNHVIKSKGTTKKRGATLTMDTLKKDLAKIKPLPMQEKIPKTREQVKAQTEVEIAHFQKVLEFKPFQENPFEALRAHLKNTVAQRQETKAMIKEALGEEPKPAREKTVRKKGKLKKMIRPKNTRKVHYKEAQKLRGVVKVRVKGKRAKHSGKPKYKVKKIDIKK